MPTSYAHILRAVLALVALPVLAPAHARTIDCQMRFSMHGWSAFYKTATGSGTITCDNGQKMAVNIHATGGGLTVGKSRIEGGLGKFTEVRNIDELLGSYATAEAHAGAARSGDAQAMTKGDVNLALSGSGQGWDLGIAFGKFVISRR
jgi:hypothetical protein